MYTSKHPYLSVMLLTVLLAASLSAQEPVSLLEQTKLIRIKKIASEWQGSVLTLHTRDGKEVHGKLLEVAGGQYHMEVGNRRVQIPLMDVTKVSFRPGLPELMLSLASAAMGGAFLAGAVLIVDEEATGTETGVAGILGVLAGGLWGYSTFYETEVIELE